MPIQQLYLGGGGKPLADGSSSANAGTSAKQIYDDGYVTSGKMIRWIDFGGSVGAKEVWCDFDTPDEVGEETTKEEVVRERDEDKQVDLSNFNNFSTAFKQARKAGNKEFIWKGKKYHTRVKGEKEKKLINEDFAINTTSDNQLNFAVKLFSG